MLGHHHKCMQLVKRSVPASDDLIENYLRQGHVDEQGSSLPGIRGHEINARLPNPPCNLCHFSTVRG